MHPEWKNHNSTKADSNLTTHSLRHKMVDKPTRDSLPEVSIAIVQWFSNFGISLPPPLFTFDISATPPPPPLPNL